jgi:hypothetical protein
MPLTQLLQAVYPDLYRVDNLDVCKTQVHHPFLSMLVMPLTQLLQAVYPDLYWVDNLDVCKTQVHHPFPFQPCH